MLALVSRPTVTTSPCSVKDGRVPLETGYTNTTTSGIGGGVVATYPQAALRAGLPHNFELDAFVPSWYVSTGPPRVSGPSDVGAGLKYVLGYTSRAVGALAVVLTAPTGVGASGTHAYVSNAAPSSSGSVQRFTTFMPSLGVAWALPNAFQVYLEGFGTTTAGPGFGGRYGSDVGLQKDIGSRFQLDVEYGDTLTVTAGLHPHYVGFGAAYLF